MRLTWTTRCLDEDEQIPPIFRLVFEANALTAFRVSFGEHDAEQLAGLSRAALMLAADELTGTTDRQPGPREAQVWTGEHDEILLQLLPMPAGYGQRADVVARLALSTLARVGLSGHTSELLTAAQTLELSTAIASFLTDELGKCPGCLLHEAGTSTGPVPLLIPCSSCRADGIRAPLDEIDARLGAR